MLKYQYIAKDLMKIIEKENLKQGDKLPSLEELMEQYQVGKNTVIKAIDLLEKHGMVYQVRGSGIFIRRHHQKGYINLLELQGFDSILREFELTSKVIELKVIPAPQKVMENLKMEEAEDVYYVKRIRYIESQILCIEESYYKKSIVTYLSKKIASDSIFSYIKDELGLKISFLDTFLRLVRLNKEQADYLDLNPGDPGIQVESIFYLNSGETFDYSRIIYHPEEAQFFVQANSYYDLL